MRAGLESTFEAGRKDISGGNVDRAWTRSDSADDPGPVLGALLAPDLGVYLERTTGFEPATLTLAR